MFSSLEALDAEDSLHVIPVTRQGAFQPKARPRARKGGAGPARAPSSGPASKRRSLPPSETDHNDPHERKPNNVAKPQKEAETAVEMNLECQGVGVTPEVFNKVGIETGPTHNAGLADETLIHSADLTEEPERNLNIDFDAAIECEPTLTLHEPIALAKVSANPVNAIIEIQERVPLPSQISSEKDATGCLSSLSQGNGLESLTVLSDAPPAFDELRVSTAFVPVELAEEHVTEVESPSEQLTHGTEDLPSSKTTGDLRKKKRQDDDQGGLVPVEDAPLVDRGTTSNSDSILLKKKEKKKKKKKKSYHNDANEQHERVSFEATSNPHKKKKRAKIASVAASVPAVDAIVAQETMQEEVTKTAAEPSKKRKKGKQAQEGRIDGKDLSSKKNKKTGLASFTFAIASQSDTEVAIEVNGAKERAPEAVQIATTKQEAQSNFEEQQEIGEAHTSKRKRRKPARFLDGADDEINSTSATIEGASRLAKKNKSQESRVDRQQDFAENDLLSEVFPSLPKKISKLKESKFASFKQVDATEVGSKATGTGKPATPAAEENQKKKFKKFVSQRRRVERRAMNPADPDLDPKKMTMKDIIRLAEAKERMLKKDNTKEAKDGNQVTVNEPEREPENDDSACMAPQVQIIDGQIVINEQSLVINAHPKDDIRTYKRVEETHAKLNYHSYMKRTRTQTWRPDETELFYKALREFGTNFAMIQHLFPGRTRKQVLLKYKKEEKCSPLRISEAMRVKPCDTSYFLEVISSLNLLPTEIADELESRQASVPVELSSSKKEIDDSSLSPGGGERRIADGAGCALKLDEPSVNSMTQETYDKRSSSPCNIEAFNSGHLNGNQELITEEPTVLNEIAKPLESPGKLPSPPRKKKSLFSYQTSAAKS